MTSRASSLLFLVVTLVASLVFARLGLWQVGRLQERRVANAAAQAERERPPLSLDALVAAGGATGGVRDNRRVSVTGRYDHAAEVVIRDQSEGGVPGVRLVTPLRTLAGDRAWLVQRGFYPSPDARTVDLRPLEESGVQWVRGIAFALDTTAEGQPRDEGGQRTWRKVDLKALRERLPYPVAPYLILQEPDSGLPAQPRRDAAPALDDGPHLNYAIQWFAFAVIALVVGFLVGFRQEGAKHRR